MKEINNSILIILYEYFLYYIIKIVYKIYLKLFILCMYI